MKKNKGGRPPKYKNADEIALKANEYFELCEKNRQQPEKAGLCLYLGIVSETLLAWSKDKRFSATIKSIQLYIQSAWVRRLNGQAATGAIFYLKNAFKDEFKDRYENEGDTRPVIIQFDKSFQKK